MSLLPTKLVQHRGDYSIFSAMDVQEEELFATFGQSINNLILRHRKHLERKRETRSAALKTQCTLKLPAQQ
jgi:hypothetical protein